MVRRGDGSSPSDHCAVALVAEIENRGWDLEERYRQAEVKDISPELLGAALIAIGERQKVVVIRESEAIPVEAVVAVSHWGGGVDLGNTAELERALEADSLVADTLVGAFVGLGNVADRIKVALREGLPRVRHVQNAEFTLVSIYANQNAAVPLPLRLGIVGVLNELEKSAVFVVSNCLLNKVLEATR